MHAGLVGRDLAVSANGYALGAADGVALEHVDLGARGVDPDA